MVRPLWVESFDVILEHDLVFVQGLGEVLHIGSRASDRYQLWIDTSALTIGTASL